MTAAESVGLPMRPFLYTLDQVSGLLSIDKKVLLKDHVYLVGVHQGRQPRDRILARNIAGVDDPRDWRVAERELVRWLRFKGFRITPAAYLKS